MLSIDERELLEDNRAFLPLVWKEAEAALNLIYQGVLKLEVTAINKEELCIMKARADGAAQLLGALKVRLSRKPPKDEE